MLMRKAEFRSSPAVFLLALIKGLIVVPLLPAQTAAEPRPAFTVASVKLHQGNGPEPIGGARPSRSGNRVRWSNVPLQLVALYAYRIPAARLSGNLLRTFGDTYDFDTIAEGTPAEDQLRLMFRSLLEDRFGIQVHWETKEMQFNRLVVSRGGPKLNPPAADPDTKIAGYKLAPGFAGVISMKVDEQHLIGRAATAEQLAVALSTALRELVVDQTGLGGTFDFDVTFQMNEELEGPSANPFIRPAIEKNLGLRVEPAKGPIEVLVIDHLGKLTEN